MISVIIPAHNEESVIARSISALLKDALPGEIEIIVVCNGCRDATAAVARQFGDAVRIIETATPSKTNALNLGDAAANNFPRVYMDADVVLSTDSVRQIRDALQAPGVLAAAPAVENVFLPDASWSVRAYYHFWMSLPYVREGMMAAGVYALNREGRARFTDFPQVIADDGYVRLLFSPAERVEAKLAVSNVWAPATLWDLILIKTRSRLGFFELRDRYPELFRRETVTKNYGRAAIAIISRPRLWLFAIPYLWVNFISRFRAHRQRRASSTYLWERDNSSRGSDTSSESKADDTRAATEVARTS